MNHECVLVSNSWPDTVVLWSVENCGLEEEEERVDVHQKRQEERESAEFNEDCDGA